VVPTSTTNFNILKKKKSTGVGHQTDMVSMNFNLNNVVDSSGEGTPAALTQPSLGKRAVHSK